VAATTSGGTVLLTLTSTVEVRTAIGPDGAVTPTSPAPGPFARLHTLSPHTPSQ
jgi:hypothetical protein